MKKMETVRCKKGNQQWSRHLRQIQKVKTTKFRSRAFIRFQATATTKTCGWSFVISRS